MTINIVLLALDSSVQGLTKVNDDGSYTVVINRNFGERRRKDTLYHELAHIIGADFDRPEHAASLERMLHTSNYFRNDADLEKELSGVEFFYHVL